MKRRAFSGLLSRFQPKTPPEPFDWPLFFKTFPLQPVVFWLVLSALAKPFALAFPSLSRAACDGRLRLAVSQLAIVGYTVLVPPILTAAFYLLFARRRLAHTLHRRVADATFGMIMILSFADGAAMFSRVRGEWTRMKPAYKAIGQACWPGPAPAAK